MPATPATQLYLIAPPVADPVASLPMLGAVVEAARPACVLLTPVASDDSAAKRIVRDVAPMVQRHDAALLVNGWSAIVARAGADGLHLAGGQKGLAEALASFKPERIVGVAGLRTRHLAMTLAETGVDYVMFGEPSADGRTPPLDEVVERVDWWAELFEIPCVAYASDLDAVAPLADAGADFVAIGSALWQHPSGPVEAAALVGRLLAQRSPGP